MRNNIFNGRVEEREDKKINFCIINKHKLILFLYKSSYKIIIKLFYINISFLILKNRLNVCDGIQFTFGGGKKIAGREERIRGEGGGGKVWPSEGDQGEGEGTTEEVGGAFLGRGKRESEKRELME